MTKHTIHDNAPWFKPETLKYVSSLLKSDWIIFETGCGSSTIWFSSRVKKVISFEHSREWYIKLKEIIENNRIKNIDLQLNPDYPEKGISGFKENEFDFVSIDGRGRVKSVEMVIPYLKSEGYLLLDDSQRERYQPAVILLNEWENAIIDKNGKQATIWRKP